MGNLFTKRDPQSTLEPDVRSPRVGWNPDAFVEGGGTCQTKPTCKGNTVSSGEGGAFGKPARLNPKDYVVSGKKNELVIREPGSIAGQQFIVEECCGCDVYLLDHSAALTLDYCSDCRIITGPCESSIFVRNCTDCTVITASQQFRTRDCQACTFFLFSATQPIIEASKGLRFACYSLSYFSLAKHFAAAKLSVWDNKWSQIFNFTGGKEDWSTLPPDVHFRDFICQALPQDVKERVGYTEEAGDRVVPITSGVWGAPTGEVTLVVIMPGHIDAVLRQVLASKNPLSTGCVLVRTKIFRPVQAQCKNFFNDDDFIPVASSGPILAMHWAGPGTTEAVVALLAAVGLPGCGQGLGAKGGYYITSDIAETTSKMKIFFEQWEEDRGQSFS